MTDQTDKWFEDPESYKSTQVDETYIIRDAYSQWIARYGAKYALTNEIPKEDDEDFNFAIIVGTNADRTVLFQAFKRFNFLETIERDDGDNVVDTVFLARLPIRASSARPADVPGQRVFPGLEGPRFSSLEDWKRGTPFEDEPGPVIVAVIDDAINFAHPRFRDAHGKSRVDFAWVQDARFNKEDSRVEFGREWNASEISDLIDEHGYDDDALMAALDLVASDGGSYRPSALNLRASHGTHIADLAAGMAPTSPAAPDTRIIAVQLPVFASQDTSGTSLMGSVVAAVQYVFERAQELSECVYKRPIPVVLNLSFGLGGGPKAGRHVVEHFMRQSAMQYRQTIGAPAIVVMPSGNGMLSRTHALGTVNDEKDRSSLDVHFRVQPQDRSSSFVEFWFPENAQNIKLRVTQPNGQFEDLSLGNPTSFATRGKLRKSFILAHKERDGTFDPRSVKMRVSVDTLSDVLADGAGNDAPHWRVVVALAPTQNENPDLPSSMVGKWSVRADCAKSGGEDLLPVRAWIHRDDAVSGFGERGRQSYFDDDAYEDTRLDVLSDLAVVDAPESGAKVKRDGTVSGIATNIPGDTEYQAISVGGAIWNDQRGTVYSGAGYDCSFNAPHFLAPAETSRALPGVLASGTRSGTAAAIGGSSVAAPQAARHLASALLTLKPSEYSTFDPLKVLQALVETPPKRPNGDLRELASNDVLRETRVNHGILQLNSDIGFEVSERRVDKH